MLSRSVIAFLPRSKRLLISWLQSPSAVILGPPKIVSHCFHSFFIYEMGIVQSLSRVPLSVTPRTAARQASLSFISRSLLKLMSIELVMPSSHLVFCRPLLLLPSIFPSVRVFNELALCIRWPKCWSFSISPSNEYSRLISFRIDWFDLLAVQETLRSLLQHHSSKISFFVAQLSLWSNSHIHTWLLEKP